MYISNESEYSSTKVIVVLSNTHFNDINKILGFFFFTGKQSKQTNIALTLLVLIQYLFRETYQQF